MASVTPFLMFEGRAEEAMRLYISLFPGAEIVSLERYDSSGPGKEGSVKLARARIARQMIMVIDSPAKHAFTFTPSMSLFVDCDSEAELDRLFATLPDGGKVMMPPGAYGFSKKFAWAADRFGVSWQLNLP